MEISSLIPPPPPSLFLFKVSPGLCVQRPINQIRYHYSLSFIKLYVLQTQELCLTLLCPPVTAGLISVIHERTQ